MLTLIILGSILLVATIIVSSFVCWAINKVFPPKGVPAEPVVFWFISF
jgi:hypothetical protein